MSTADPLASVPASPAGEDFERFFWGLLRRKYPQGDLVFFPADLGGDKGLEGYSCDGIGYQCYADRDSLTLRNRTDKQKRKLTRDTSKLKEYATDLRKLLHDVKLRYYFLVVPEYNATELVAHANSRADKVRGWGLDFIADDFEIRIKTPQDYPEEYQAAIRAGVGTLDLPDPNVGADEVAAFPDGEPILVRNLSAKLERLSVPQPSRDGLRTKFINWYLEKEELMAALQAWPETFEALERRRQVREEQLEFENGFSTQTPHERVASVVREYADQLREEISGLDQAHANRIARGQAGEWLMRCPLEFQDLT